jgi:hypothetical protein
MESYLWPKKNNFSRRHFLASAAVTIGAVGFGMTASAKTRSGVRGELASLVDAKVTAIQLQLRDLSACDGSGKLR